MKTGIELIAEERQRQIKVEGWTPEHDAEHTDNSMAKAAACYAMPNDEREKYQSFTFSEPKRWYPRWWPKSWDVNWWKPTPENRIKELVKAGALIAAEIDRINAISKVCDSCEDVSGFYLGTTCEKCNRPFRSTLRHK